MTEDEKIVLKGAWEAVVTTRHQLCMVRDYLDNGITSLARTQEQMKMLLAASEGALHLQGGPRMNKYERQALVNQREALDICNKRLHECWGDYRDIQGRIAAILLAASEGEPCTCKEPGDG